ncbi:MAG: cytidylate kinase family protein [Spirochaetia bacterium]|nr:cytidylate kinase family protein [Spirochaetia bacterium]
MIIAISGKSGCGNTTVSTKLAAKLGLTLVNYTFRNLAADTGKDFKEICQAAKTDFSYDKIIDSHQVELARKGNCVLGSRLAIWMVDFADLKVFLEASIETRANRILKREGGTFQERYDETAARDESDTGRYKALYGIDNNQHDFADMIIDTALHTPDQIVDLIVAEVQRRGLK